MANYYDPQRYALTGPQIEPEAGHWTFAGELVRVVNIHSLHPSSIPDPYDIDPGLLENDLQELAHLASIRNDPTAVAGTFKATPPVGKPYGTPDLVDRTRKPLSIFLKHQPPPITSQIRRSEQEEIADILMPCAEQEPFVVNGRDLARLFEDETPGLLHRHALNCLLFRRSVSPPRQARIWMALDVAIYSALLAAWHIKWGHRDTNKSGDPPDYTRVYRERPIIWEARVAAAENRSERYSVLFDYEIDEEGNDTTNRRCPSPFVSPGTPRHPAYPSGHSTYSAAASKVMAHFFPDAAVELENLADNIGMARLWGGVHWRQDHTAGQMLGGWVADEIIKQLCHDPVRPIPTPMPSRCDATKTTPSFSTVEQGKKYRSDHANGKCEANQDTIPAPSLSIQEFQGQRGAF
ncbi:phosphatase PAP2 family protein [Methylobacterium sp. Leaf94]|uniref:phosphatase PAP2 family protein n=1 Tax=Methylobacterium sp. Leaf94 TaxID=1736250 RepID=UPI0009E9CB45|nr:phosphatase PAP2 family protein [Methylobacterium sp. Leaf94]